MFSIVYTWQQATKDQFEIPVDDENEISLWRHTQFCYTKNQIV